jgi:hypothetical protein
MERYYIVHQAKGKFLNVFFIPFPFQKLLPSLKQVIQTDNIFKIMSQLNFHKNFFASTPPTLLPILQKAKGAYLLWYQYYPIIPKTHRYSLGQKIDNFFVDAIEAISIATFLPKEEKLPYVRLAIRKLDTLKIFLMLLWETKSLDNKKYINLSLKIDEIGKMLGGWQGQLLKQNSLKKPREK